MKHRTLLVVLGVVAILLMGIAGLAYWGWGLFADQAKEALNANPVIQEHVGTIRKLSLDFEGTGEEEDEDTFVFKVEGTKASGTVKAEFISVDEDTEELASGTLTLESGESYDLVPAPADPAPVDVPK